jgi:hypothetical protein
MAADSDSSINIFSTTETGKKEEERKTMKFAWYYY